MVLIMGDLTEIVLQHGSRCSPRIQGVDDDTHILPESYCKPRRSHSTWVKLGAIRRLLPDKRSLVRGYGNVEAVKVKVIHLGLISVERAKMPVLNSREVVTQ